MFTDIVGYTALMGKDEAKALRILQKNRDVLKPFIASHQGKWLKEMGDGTLSSFPSAVEAVNCALEIQRSLKDEEEFKLGLRIFNAKWEQEENKGNDRAKMYSTQL